MRGATEARDGVRAVQNRPKTITLPATSVAMTPSLLMSATRRAVQTIQQGAHRLVGALGDFDALLAVADDHLYAAKQSGRNRVVG